MIVGINAGRRRPRSAPRSACTPSLPSAQSRFPARWPWCLGLLAANHLALGAAGMAPRTRLLGPNLTRLPPGRARRGEVALTFDDGPDPAVTPLLLDLLDRHGARASFFVIGRRAARHPALLRDMVGRGHTVENHSHRHSAGFAAYPMPLLARDLAAAQAAIADATGRLPRYFRAPMGLRSPLLHPVLCRLGLRQVSWTRRGLDTRCGEPGRVLARLADGLAGGSILLLHDGNAARTEAGQPVVLAVLPALLARISAAGLRAVAL